jgi:hypothetical protein
MDQRTPLTSEQIAELKDLPPQTRHAIINRHLTTLNEEIKRKADLARTEAETTYRTAMATKAEKELREGSTEKNAAEATRGLKELAELREKTTKAREDKIKAVEQLDTNILTLQGLVGDKVREKATAKKGAGQGIDLEIATLQEKITQAEAKKKRLEGDLQKEVEGLKKKRPDLFPEEAPAPAQEVLSPEAQQFLYSLSDVDRQEVYKAMQTRKDLSQEAIIQAYAAYKRQANPVAPPQGRIF